MRASAGRPDPLPWAVGLAASLFYLQFHSTFYNFDGVACAIAVELGDCRRLVHGNHLAYGWLGLAFERLWRLLGYAGPALLSLQAMDSLLGGSAAGLFCSCLLRLGIRRGLATACASGLALSHAYWFWSLEAQVYMLGVFFLTLAASEALAERPRPVALGLAHAMAVLGHVGHALFAPAALYGLWLSARGSSRWRSLLASYLLALSLSLAAAYAAAALFCVRPASWEDWRLWLLGSAALGVDRAFHWHGGYSWHHLKDWAAMTPRLFAELEGTASGARLAALGLCAAALAAAGLGALEARKGRSRHAARLALIWMFSYALLYASWQPYVIVYRISDLPALWLLIALGLNERGAWALARAMTRASASSEGRWGAAALPGLWALAAGWHNARSAILPSTDASRNVAHQEALWIASATPPEAWIVATSLGQVYIPYFAHRRPLNLRYFQGRPQDLAARLDELSRRGEPAFVSRLTLETGGFREALEAYGLEEASARGEGVLYKLKRKGSPKAGARKS